MLIFTTGDGCYWYPVGRGRPGVSQNVLKCTGQPLTEMHYPKQNVNRAEYEKSYKKVLPKLSLYLPVSTRNTETEFGMKEK